MWAHGFRVSFTPLSEVLFTFPSRYSSAIGLSVVFSLAGWSPRIQPGFLVPRPTQAPPKSGKCLRVRGSHPLWPGIPAGSADIPFICWRPYNPGTCLATPPVWAPPRSLAATGGIVLTFSSWRYLDVSVHAVRPTLCVVVDSHPLGCPIRTSGGRSAFATRPGFSQLVTSFIASESPGIPHAPFFVPLFLRNHGRASMFDFFRLAFVPPQSMAADCVLTSFGPLFCGDITSFGPLSGFADVICGGARSQFELSLVFSLRQPP